MKTEWRNVRRRFDTVSGCRTMDQKDRLKTAYQLEGTELQQASRRVLPCLCFCPQRHQRDLKAPLPSTFSSSFLFFSNSCSNVCRTKMDGKKLEGFVGSGKEEKTGQLYICRWEFPRLRMQGTTR